MKNKEAGKFSSHIITLYVFIIFCIYPLYYEDGYYNMGTAKCRFFLGTSVIFFFVILVAVALDMVRWKKREDIVFELKGLSVTEKLLFVYMGCVLLAYIFSDFKQ